ncbi:MAG TPA: isochorismatase family protein [Streptosporangiaceae bacterium]|nr:isochorismatase family protein [Streptosporangiaceae bacterium]
MTGAPPPWLAVIDMQEVFADPGSAWFTPRFGEIVGPVKELVAAFRPRVTFTRFVAPAEPAGAWRRYYEQWPFALRPPDDPIYRLVADFADDAAAAAGLEIAASTFGKWGPQLEGMVGDGGRLVLAGVSTDCCVLSTAVAAADAGIGVQVVADACAGVNDEIQAQALALLRLYAPLIEVVSLGEAVAGARADRSG